MKFSINPNRYKTSLFIIIAAAMLIVLGITVVNRTIPEDNVLGVYYNVSRLILKDGDIYSYHNAKMLSYIYPPFLAIIFVPLSLLPPFMVAVLWYFFNILSWFLCLIVGIKMLQDGNRPMDYLAYLLPLVACARFFIHNLNYGQASIFLIFPAYCGLKLMENKKDIIGGLIFSVSLAIKFFPVIIIPYLLLKKRFLFITGAIIGIILWYVIFPSMVVGFDKNIQYMERWIGIIKGIQSKESLDVTFSFLNQSFRAALNRLFSNLYKNYFPYRKKLLETLEDVIHLAILTILISAATIKIAKIGELNQGYQIALTASILYLCIPFITFSAWKHHFVYMLMPYCVAFFLWLRGRLEHKWQRWFITASVVLCNLNPILVGKSFSRLLHDLSVIILGILLLMIVLLSAPNKL